MSINKHRTGSQPLLEEIALRYEADGQSSWRLSICIPCPIFLGDRDVEEFERPALQRVEAALPVVAQDVRKE